MRALARRKLGRTDRYVRKGRMTLSAEAPPRKLVFFAEESLRLCALPGEEQGKVYYFRRLHIKDLPESGDRRIWLEAFQSALQQQAQSAVHGIAPSAASADAVFFQNEQEACECLIRTLSASITPSAWFWKHVVGSALSLPSLAFAERVIERLLETPASWSAVAASIMAIRDAHETVSFLKLLPERAIDGWTRELGLQNRAYAAPIHLPEAVSSLLRKLAAIYGAQAPEVLWVAALAVIVQKPASVESQSAVAIARATLRAMNGSKPNREKAEKISRPSLSQLFVLKQEQEVNKDTASGQEIADRDEKVRDQVPERPREARIECYGEPTAGAGLFFLLNALRVLRVSDDPINLRFLVHLFEHIARDAEITDDDPIRIWARGVQTESDPEDVDERSVRIWCWKIRRWCWRTGRIAMREVVRRPGFVTLTRTDLDVTMSIDSADIRIRRIGLDLDPGWVPWFGRVVHFHYRFRGDLLE